MTIKIDKYHMGEYKNKWYIFNRANGKRIISIESLDPVFNEKMGKAILKELNTGEYENLEEETE